MATKQSTAVVKAKQSLPANFEEEMAAEIAAFNQRLAAPSGDRIKTSNDKIFTLPNGDTADMLSAIIVDFVSFNAYYDKPYNPKADAAPPNCFALGLEPASMIPSANSPDKQCESCTACWANQWKSSQTGNGKACNNTKLLALMMPDDLNGEEPLMILKVSPTAQKAFDSYVASVARIFQRPPRGVITDIGFDPNTDYASLRFANPRPVDAKQLAAAYARKQEALERLLVEPDVSGFEAAKPAPKGRTGLQAPRSRKTA